MTERTRKEKTDMETHDFALYVDTQDLALRFIVHFDGTQNQASVLADWFAQDKRVWRVQVYAPQFVYESRGQVEEKERSWNVASDS
jgi:hypothetical protein